MSKITFNNGDFSKCLLTEVLPYETPFIFSNANFFMLYNGYVNKTLPSKVRSFFQNFFIMKNDAHKIPFNFQVSKSGGEGKLLLSIMHPASQTSFVDFYKDYESMLISLCARSSFSLRYPASTHGNVITGSKDEDRPLRGAEVDILAEGFVPESAYPSSYFVYKKYSMLHEFHDSYEYQRLEKKFNYLMKFDITKCFYNIYTHSISWSVKSKKFAKANISYENFEGRFDRLMQRANYNETNGILVGPEASRIFAEIILQKIDIDVEAELRVKGLFSKRDYDVRRYVDDIFVFADNKQNLQIVREEFEKCLAEYKLFINEKKTEFVELPSITGLTVAKTKASAEIKSLFDVLIESSEDGKRIRNIGKPAQLARNTIRRIKANAFECHVSVDKMSSIILTTFRRKTDQLCRIQQHGIAREFYENLASAFAIIVDICSYIVACDLRVRSTLLFGQILFLIKERSAVFPGDIAESVKNKLVEELTLLIGKSGGSFKSIEKLNLMLTLLEICPDQFVNNKHIGGMFDGLHSIAEMEMEEDMIERIELNYFSIITLLYCMQDKACFSDHRRSVVKIIKNVILSSDMPFSRSDLAMLVVDVMACPYISQQDKREILKLAYRKHPETVKCSDSVIAGHVNEIGCHYWFVDWNALSMERLLMKKELRPAYES